MSSALKFYFYKLLCSKNAVIAPNRISNSQNFWGSVPRILFAAAHPIPTFSRVRPVLHAVRLSASVSTVPTLRNDR